MKLAEWCLTMWPVKELYALNDVSHRSAGPDPCRWHPLSLWILQQKLWGLCACFSTNLVLIGALQLLQTVWLSCGNSSPQLSALFGSPIPHTTWRYFNVADMLTSSISSSHVFSPLLRWEETVGQCILHHTQPGQGFLLVWIVKNQTQNSFLQHQEWLAVLGWKYAHEVNHELGAHPITDL